MKNDAVLDLLSIYQELQEINSINELAFFMTHQTSLVFPYKIAVAWDGFNQHDIKIKSITTLTEVDNNTPFSQDVRQIIAASLKIRSLKQELMIVKKSKLSDAIQENWPEEIPDILLFRFFITKKEIIGGLCLCAEQEPNDGKELAFLNWVTSAYAFHWSALLNDRNVTWKLIKQRLRYKKTYWIATIIIVILCLIPVKQSVVASVEIVPKDAAIITAPLDGVVKSINVSSEENIQAGALIIIMEKRDLESANDLSEQEYLTAKERYHKAIRSSFKDIKSRAEIKILASRLTEKYIEKQHTNTLLSMAKITSPISGTVVVNDINGWAGKPVKTGQRIMMIANPKNVEALAWLPVSDAINFKRGDNVSIYLNNNPLSTVMGKVQYMGYQAELSPKNILAYRIAITLDVEGAMTPRIGSEGTARIKGNYTILFYYLFRKPISYVRQTLGW